MNEQYTTENLKEGMGVAFDWFGGKVIFTSDELEEMKADDAARKKESEIEKTPADVLAGNSPNAAALGRRKDELKSDFNSRADSITENFLHTRGRASSCGSAES